MNKPRQKAVEKLVTDLMAIEGSSGHEGRVMEFIAKQLRRAGAPAEAIQYDQVPRRSPYGGEIGNMVCKLPGSFRGKRRMLMAHVDTVPLCVGTRPVTRGAWIEPADKGTALGADNRCGTAVVLATAIEILRGKLPHPPLSFFFTVQEEVGLYGARLARLSMLGNPRLVFNFDGGSPEKLTVGATGGYRMTIDVTGIAAHAGNAPENGVSAIAIASLAIASLHRTGWHGRIRKNGYQGTSNIGTIRGGAATNVVTPRTTLRAEARSHDPAFRREIVRNIEQAFEKAARSVRNRQGDCGSVEFDGQLDYEAFRLADDAPCVLAAEAAIQSLGGEPVCAVCNGGLDANWLFKRGMAVVTLGCGQSNPHTVSERMHRAEFHRACEIALVLASQPD